MVIDASAILAILLDEPEADDFKYALADAQVRHISPVNWFEVAIRAESAGKIDYEAFADLMKQLSMIVVPVDAAHMRLAHRAWLKFGKGRDKAKLNLGDCFAYALAKSLGEPLLYKGKDFSQTDIQSVL